MIKNMRIYYFLVSIVSGFFATAMPLYYESLNFNGIQVGILIAIPSFVMLLQPMWGIIVDKYQRPKEIAIFGLTTSSILLLLLLITSKFYVICIVVFLYALFKAPVWSTVDNIIVTYCMNKNIKYGPLRVFASIAWGSSLLIMYPFIIMGGFKVFFIINLVLSLILGYMVYKLPSETKLADNLKEDQTFAQGMKVLLSNKSFYFLTLFTLFFSTIFVTNLNYQALYFEELNYGALFIAIAMFISIVPEFFILPVIEKITAKGNPIFWLIIVCLLYFIKFYYMSISTNIYGLIFIVSFHGIAMSIYIPVFIKFLKRLVPNNVSTVAITINGFVAAISGIIMSLVAGIVRENAGVVSVFRIDSLMMIISIVLLIIFWMCLNKKVISL